MKFVVLEERIHKQIITQDILDEDSLHKIMVSIDPLIDDKGFQIMKLSMRSELSQDERDKAKHPSDLICKSLRKHYHSPEEIVSRIHYSLEILGHRRYGYRAVNKMKEYVQEVTPFDIKSLPREIEWREFALHQCLAIVCRLVSSPSEGAFIHRCVKKLGHNPENYETPCDILTELLALDRLTPDNHKAVIEEAMIEAGVSENILKEYHEICYQLCVSGELEGLFFAMPELHARRHTVHIYTNSSVDNIVS